MKVGDRVVGKNQTYQRTVYEVVEIKQLFATELLLKPISFYGYPITGKEQEHSTFWRPLDEFRLITEEDFNNELLLSLFNKETGVF